MKDNPYIMHFHRNRQPLIEWIYRIHTVNYQSLKY
jgi:hypothetical protein